LPELISQQSSPPKGSTTVAMTAAWIDATSQWPICGDLGRGPQSHEAG